jgi:hypothetical protein
LSEFDNLLIPSPILVKKKTTLPHSAAPRSKVWQGNQGEMGDTAQIAAY